MKYKMKKTPEDRLWAKVDKTGGPDACWPWVGGKTGGGYGQFYRFGKKTLCHRAALYYHSGEPIFDETCVLHKCDNPACCNPAHLFTGTQSDNMVDKTIKNRQASGEKSGTSKLSSRAITAIKILRSLGWRQKTISTLFRISQAHVSGILAGKYRRFG